MADAGPRPARVAVHSQIAIEAHSAPRVVGLPRVRREHHHDRAGLAVAHDERGVARARAAVQVEAHEVEAARPARATRGRRATRASRSRAASPLPAGRRGSSAKPARGWRRRGRRPRAGRSRRGTTRAGRPGSGTAVRANRRRAWPFVRAGSSRSRRIRRCRSCEGCGAYQPVVPARAFSAGVEGTAACAGAQASQAAHVITTGVKRFARI